MAIRRTPRVVELSRRGRCGGGDHALLHRRGSRRVSATGRGSEPAPGPRGGPRARHRPITGPRAGVSRGAAAAAPCGPGHGQPHDGVPGDRPIPLVGVWRERFPDPAEQAKLQAGSDSIEERFGYSELEHVVMEYTDEPKGVPAADLDAEQREML